MYVNIVPTISNYNSLDKSTGPTRTIHVPSLAVNGQKTESLHHSEPQQGTAVTQLGHSLQRPTEEKQIFNNGTCTRLKNFCSRAKLKTGDIFCAI